MHLSMIVDQPSDLRKRRGGGRSQTPRRLHAAGKGVFRTYRTQSHRRSRHVTGTDPDTGWLTMHNFDSSIDLAGQASYAVDVERGLLYLAERIVPITMVDGAWTLDSKRSTVELANIGCVPVVPIGGA